MKNYLLFPALTLSNSRQKIEGMKTAHRHEPMSRLVFGEDKTADSGGFANELHEFWHVCVKIDTGKNQ